MSDKEWSCQNCGTDFMVSLKNHNICINSPKPKTMKCPHCGSADSWPSGMHLHGEAGWPSWMRFSGGVKDAAEDYARQGRNWDKAQKGQNKEKKNWQFGKITNSFWGFVEFTSSFVEFAYSKIIKTDYGKYEQKAIRNFKKGNLEEALEYANKAMEINSGYQDFSKIRKEIKKKLREQKNA